MLLTGVVRPSPLGVVASLAAMTTSSVGFIVSVRWRGDQDVLSMTAWQLVAGGLVVVPFAAIVEGAPPPLDGRELAGFAHLTVVATVIAYVAWFFGLARLDAGAVGLIGLLNPATGVASAPHSPRRPSADSSSPAWCSCSSASCSDNPASCGRSRGSPGAGDRSRSTSHGDAALDRVPVASDVTHLRPTADGHVRFAARRGRHHSPLPHAGMRSCPVRRARP